MTLQQYRRTSAFTRDLKSGPNPNQYTSDLETAEILDKEDKTDYAKKEEGELFDMVRQLSPSFGFIGDAVPVVDDKKRLFAIGNTLGGDNQLNRTVYEIYAPMMKKFMQHDPSWTKTTGLDSFDKMNGQGYNLLGSKPLAGSTYQDLTAFYPVKYRDESRGFKPIPGSWDWKVDPALSEEEVAALPDINKLGLSKGDITGRASQNIFPFASGLRALMPYVAPPQTLLQKKRALDEAKEPQPVTYEEEKKTVTPRYVESNGPEASVTLNGLMNGLWKDGYFLDPIRGEVVDKNTGEVIFSVALNRSRQRATAPEEPMKTVSEPVERSTSDLFSDMLAVRKSKKKTVTDENGNVDIVRSSTSSLFKSRIRGNR